MEKQERLIDVNALDLTFPVTDDMSGMLKQIGINMVKARLMEAPTVEAIAVPTRCINCRFAKMPSPAVQKYGVPGTRSCKNQNSPASGRLVFPDGYCPYGEKEAAPHG
jgi:hypothetical protein